MQSAFFYGGITCMKKLKVGYLIIASLLVWVLVQFFLLPAICSAEPVYMITETELMTLEQNSNRQLEINSQLAKKLQIATSIERSQTANRSAAEAVDRCTELVEEAGRIAADNLEILATIRTRGTAGDRGQD